MILSTICRYIITHLLFKCHSIIIFFRIIFRDREVRFMPVLGIISEYNPYHRGHALLLEKAKEMTGAEHSVSVMSGCFSQQGLPMIRDKYLRASAAAAEGIDLVFELPTLFATGSARDFAGGGVALLSAFGTDALCFGVETPDPALFDEIADLIAEEPDQFRTLLKEEQKKGESYPAARETAIASILGDTVRPFLREPNNILALEYVTAIRRQHSPMRPYYIQRTTDYHCGPAGSATAVRNHMTALREEGTEDPAGYLEQVLPSGSYDVYHSCRDRFLLSSEGLMPYLASRMLELPEELPKEELPMDMTPEMYRRLRRLTLPSDYETILTGLKRKNETRGRISRSLLHLILGIREKDRITFPEDRELPLYLNLLAGRKDSTSLLRDRNGLSIITKKSAFQPADPHIERMWELDCRAAALYSQLLHDACGDTLPGEMQQSPIVM